jgi:hypothetical protein
MNETAYSVAGGGQAYVIDGIGHIRQVLNADPGRGTAATSASFASLLAGAPQQALRSQPGPPPVRYPG